MAYYEHKIQILIWFKQLSATSRIVSSSFVVLVELININWSEINKHGYVMIFLVQSNPALRPLSNAYVTQPD